MILSKIKKAFTLVEMLIAILVFSIGVLAVLNLITDNLWIMSRLDIKNQSNFLWKEAIELVFNMRDSNLVKKLPWNCVLSEDALTSQTMQYLREDTLCAGYFGSGNMNIFSISFNPEYYFIVSNFSQEVEDFDTMFQKYRVYYSTGENISWYWENSDTGEETFFARYILFKPIIEWWNVLPTNKILKLESHVLYQKWSRTGEYIFESFIWNH